MNILAYLFIKTHSYRFRERMELLRHGMWVPSTSDVTASHCRAFVSLHTQQQSMSVLVGVCLSKHLELFFCHSGGYVVVFHCGFYLILLITSEAEH